ncbi:MAG: hypothetical protein V9H69_26795 [Anaerolineae bacterium]
MSAEESADAQAELDQVEELTQRPDPPAKRIVRTRWRTSRTSWKQPA